MVTVGKKIIISRNIETASTLLTLSGQDEFFVMVSVWKA